MAMTELVTYYYKGSDRNEEKINQLFRDLVRYAEVNELESHLGFTQEGANFILQMRPKNGEKACTIIVRHPYSTDIKINQGITNWLTDEDVEHFFDVSELNEKVREMKVHDLWEKEYTTIRHDTKMLIKVRFGRYYDKR